MLAAVYSAAVSGTAHQNIGLSLAWNALHVGPGVTYKLACIYGSRAPPPTVRCNSRYAGWRCCALTSFFCSHENGTAFVTEPVYLASSHILLPNSLFPLLLKLLVRPCPYLTRRHQPARFGGHRRWRCGRRGAFGGGCDRIGSSGKIWPTEGLQVLQISGSYSHCSKVYYFGAGGQHVLRHCSIFC